MAFNYARTVAKTAAPTAAPTTPSLRLPPSAPSKDRGGRACDERFLVPALEDDGVLFEWEEFVGTDAAGQEEEDDDDEGLHGAEAVDDDEDDPVVNAEIAASSTNPRVTAELARQLSAAIEENDALRLKMLELTGEPKDEAPTNVGAALLPAGVVKSKRSPAKPVPVKPSPRRSDPRPDRRSALPTVDEDYFGGYGFFDIHRTMLDDVPRTAAYRDALERNPRDGAEVLGGLRHRHPLDAPRRCVRGRRRRRGADGGVRARQRRA